MLLYPQLNSYKRMSLAIRTEMDITSFISTNVIISVISINVKITLIDFAPTVKVSVTRPNLPLMSGEQVTFFFPHDFSIIFQYCHFYSNLNSEIYFNFLSTSASSLWSTSASESSVFLSTSTRLHCSFSCPRWTWSLQPIIEIRLRLMRNLFVLTRNW